MLNSNFIEQTVRHPPKLQVVLITQLSTKAHSCLTLWTTWQFFCLWFLQSLGVQSTAEHMADKFDYASLYGKWQMANSFAKWEIYSPIPLLAVDFVFLIYQYSISSLDFEALSKLHLLHV